MKASYLATAAALFSLAAGTFIFIRHEQQLATTEALAEAESRPAAEVNNIKPQVDRTIPGAPGMRLTLEGSSSFESLRQRVINASPADKAQGLAYLVSAARVCEDGARRASEKSYGLQAGSQSHQVYSRYVQSFCKDFSGSSESYQNELLAMGENDVNLAQDLAWEAASDKGLNRAERASAEQLFLTSKSPSAIYNAASILAGSSDNDGGQWQFGQDLAETASEKIALSKAQWIASQMLVCDLSGGCGAGGLTSAIECGSYSMCEDGITVNDVLKKTSTPIEYDLAKKLYQRLYKDREMAANLPRA